MLNASNKGNYYHIYNTQNPNFDLKLPKTSLNTIIKLYGEEQIQFNSFIIYINQETNLSIVTQKKTMKKELDDNEANIISEKLNNLGKYFIIPESLKELDEDKQFEQSIKIKGKCITHIMKKAGINFESMIFYLGLQIISQEISENVVIDYYTFEKIFKLISLLTIKFNSNKNNLDITFYSFRQILKNCGIKLEDILPFLHIDITNLERNNINNEDLPLIKFLKIRQLKELISPEVQNTNIDLMKGTESLLRINKNNFEDLDMFRNNQSNFLKDIIKKIEVKKEEIKDISENEENQINEIIKENKVFYVKKKLYDNLMKNMDNYDEVKIKDIKGDDVILNKDDLKENLNNEKEPLIKLIKNNNKNEFILIPKDEIEKKFNEFKYIKQEGNFNGKGINNEPKELKGLFMDINCDTLSEINNDIIPIEKINDNIEIKEEQIILSPAKEEEEIKNISPNSQEKLRTNNNIIQNDDLEPEYENIINPYNNMTFKQIRTLKREEYKNDNDEEKLRSINEKGINTADKRTYRIRRAILFKRPSGEEKENEKEKEKKIS